MNPSKLSPASLVLILLASSVAQAGSLSPKERGLRLIETAPGKVYWASPAEIEAISEKQHLQGKCGGFFDLTDEPQAAPLAPFPQAILALGDRDPKEQARVTPLLKEADAGNLIAIVTKLSAYESRHCHSETGVEAAKWIHSEYARIGKDRSDIRVEFVNHSFKQPSVIATIEGNGPNKNEIVVIGGHLDSISHSKKAPGADDNASGTATVMETFRILVESGYRPNRTLQFMGYAGEELGLLGSRDIASAYRRANRPVVAALQFDMTMYPGPTPRITFISDHVDRDLTKFTEKLSDEYVKAIWIEDRCGYACSDHASWTRSGYPSAFPFESKFNNSNPDIHTPNDTVANLDASHGLHYLKLSLAFAVEMAEATNVADSPRVPDDDRTPGSSWPSRVQRFTSKSP